MMEREYPPLTVNCVKNLVDKSFEKRKLAAPEIERVIKEAFLSDNKADIIQLIGYFGQDFMLSPNPHTRKGGLLGLASVAIGLNQYASIYHGPIILPVIRAFHDNDPSVRYFACETLYNIMKLTRKETLSILAEVFDVISRSIADSDVLVHQGALQCDRLLKEITTESYTIDTALIVSLLRERIYTNSPLARQFVISWVASLFCVPGLMLTTYLPQLLDGLFRILGDANPDIRRQCEILLSDLLADIQSNPVGVAFNEMINILIVHCHPSAKAVPSRAERDDSGSQSLLPDASTASSSTVGMDAMSQSASLLKQHSRPLQLQHQQSTLTNSGAQSTMTTVSPTAAMSSANSATVFTSLLGNSGEHLRRRTALAWILAFVQLDRPAHLLSFTSGILNAVLPCFIVHDNLTNTRDDWRVVLQKAADINEALLKAINDLPLRTPTDDVVSSKDSSTPVQSEAIDKTTTLKSDKEAGGAVALTCDDDDNNDLISTDAILEVTCRLLEHQSLLTRLAAFHWIEVLGRVRRDRLLRHVRQLLPVMLNLLGDPADEMVHAAIRLVGNLSDRSSDRTGSGDRQDSNDGVDLSLPEVLSEALRPSRNQTSGTGTGFSFVCLRFLHDLVWWFDRDTRLLSLRGDMIIGDLCHVLGAEPVYRILSTIITHTTDLKSAPVLVQALNRILLTQPQLHEFRNHLRAIRTKDGCLLLEGLYRAWCHNPVSLLSLCLLSQSYQQCSRLIKSLGELTITVDTLVDMDQLIQMIESPIFATLRLHLLDRRFTAPLRESLYCLLMCLPQTDAFQTLWRRLQCLPATEHISEWQAVSHRVEPDFELINRCVPFDALFEHFHEVQKRHQSQQSLPTATPILSLLNKQIQQFSCSGTRGQQDPDEFALRRSVCGAARKNMTASSVVSYSSSAAASLTHPASQSTGSTVAKTSGGGGSAADFLAESLANMGVHISPLRSSIGVPPI